MLAISLTACTNSPFAWKLLYGQFDNYLSRQLIGYAQFTEIQKELIRSEVGNTVFWHRQTELPKYAQTITEFQQRYLANQSITNEVDMDWLLDEIRQIGLRFDQKSPLLALIPLLAQLTDKQVEQISKTIDNEFIDAQKEWDRRADQDPAEHAEKSLSDFFKHLGVSTTQQQKQLLVESLSQRQLSRELQQKIWRQWCDQLLDILNVRGNRDFAEVFTAHHFARLDLVQDMQPEKWEHDRILIKNMFSNLLHNLSAKQKSSMNLRLEKLKEVALELSEQG